MPRVATSASIRTHPRWPPTIVNRTPGSAPATPESATRLVGAFTAAPAVIRQLGVDPAPIIAAAGLAPEVFDDPSNRIPYEGALRLLNEAAERTRCPHIGLLIGRMWRTSDLGLLGELVRHAPTVGAALQEFVVNHHLNSEGALAFVVQRDSVVDIGYAVYVPFAGSYSQLYDGALAALVSFLRELCGDGWSPAAVFLSHSAPADVAPYRQYFQAPLHFGSDVCALRFGANWLARPVAGADPRAPATRPREGAGHRRGHAGREGAPDLAHLAAAWPELRCRCRAVAGDAPAHPRPPPERGRHHLPAGARPRALRGGEGTPRGVDRRP